MKLGNCYELAAEALLAGNLKCFKDYPDATVYLAHGYPTGTGGDAEHLKYGHAWIELYVNYGNILVANVGNFKGDKVVLVPQLVYYAVGSINCDEVTRYTRKQTRTNMLDSEHWGPWENVPDDAEFGETAINGNSK